MSKAADAAEQADEDAPGATDEVKKLKGVGEYLLRRRCDKEHVAKTLDRLRRELGVKYKGMTPPDLLDLIHCAGPGTFVLHE